MGRLPDGEQTTQLMGYRITYRGAKAFRYLFREIFVDGAYYFHQDNIRPTIIDCGSNVGVSVLFFKRLYPQCKIIAFEPDPETFATLERNVRDNGLSDVSCHQMALGDADGSVDFYQDENIISSLAMSTLHERMPTTKKISVPARKLSTFIDCDVDLLKIDIEGAEVKVLRDLHETGKLRSVKRMHLEYHHHIDATRDDLSTTLKMLEQDGFGYQIKSLQPQWPMEQEFQDISIYCYQKRDLRLEDGR
jgi:FkbM family methyltransferase